MARRKTRKRSTSEKIWITIGILAALSMVLALFAPVLVR